MAPQTLLFILGTRPEAIKLAPLIRACQVRPASFAVKVCITGQHRELVEGVLPYFDIQADFDLKIMTIHQTLTDITTRTLSGLDPLLKAQKPDWVIVQGDTTAAFSGALAAYYQQIKVAHIEAGLRSHDSYAPFPEEMNRQCISRLAARHFAPTEGNRLNLLKEGIAAEQIHLVGNTVVDALQWTIKKEGNRFSTIDPTADLAKKTILVTAHRRENWGDGIHRIASALKMLTWRFPVIDIKIVLHPNPAISETMRAVLGDTPQIIWLPPLDYKDFIQAMYESYLVLTDSGGIQEEATALQKPVLILRAKTERDEIVTDGSALLVGTETQFIVDKVSALLTDKALYETMTHHTTPFGDGRAANRIVSIFEELKP